ncbi:hypothetical protein QBC47DRAFT_454088 [Echria macrotheca]|uniref:Nephrocystin 3-like N-terminal domain-containing protein n=1 Tax=Echria macrotheca TaxID=438768 RepID=A0AAJ0B9P3_9PEZI|nr:hypothetical protein QBC47DRAFT_454088 [Echria macrotheca]
MMALVAQQAASPSTLPADVRLGQAISEFGSELDGKHRPAFKTWQTRSPPTEIDVIRLTEEVNHDGSRLHGTAWKPFGTRLVGDIVIAGSQNLLASGVWAVVRLSLEVATGYLSYFDKVSLLLMKLGRSSTIQRDRVALFPRDEELREYICEYLLVIVDLCRTIVRFEKRHFLSQFATSIGTDKEFRAFEERLGVWSRFIGEKLACLNEKEDAEARTAIATVNKGLSSFWTSSKQREAEDRRLDVLSKLSPRQDEFERTWRRERRKGTVEWLRNEEKYKSWRDCSISSTLLVYGSIGSGKTVAMTNIFAELLSAVSVQGQEQPGDDSPAQNSPYGVSAIFCQLQNQSPPQPHDIFGSIAHQFIKSLALPATHPAIKRHKAFFAAQPNDAESVVKYLTRYFPKDRHYYVVIDALDELDHKTCQETVKALRQLQNSFHTHICSAARFDSVARQVVCSTLWSVQEVSMTSPQKDKELEDFIEAELVSRTQISTEVRRLIRDAFVAGAQGMYLWVVLQMDALFPLYQETAPGLVDIVNFLDHLPENLSLSFERALETIRDKRYKGRIFELVAAALRTRPLEINELRVALNVKPGVTKWDASAIPLDAVAAVYRYGGGLLEIDEQDNTVHFIHHSVLQHLTPSPELLRGSPESGTQLRNQEFKFTLDHADFIMGYTCLTALHYEQFDQRLARKSSIVMDQASIQGIAANASRSSVVFRAVSASSNKFDMSAVIESLGRVSQGLDEGPTPFSKYAKTYWWHHTARPSPDKEDELGLHTMFLRLLAENAPETPDSDDRFRILEYFSGLSEPIISALSCHSDRLGEIMSFADMETLENIGYSNNVLTSLKIFIERIFSRADSANSVLLKLLKAGAATPGYSASEIQPIVRAIQKDCRHGYELLKVAWGRTSVYVPYRWKSHMVDAGEGLRECFSQNSWPVNLSTKSSEGGYTYTVHEAVTKILVWLIRTYGCRETDNFVAANGMTPLGLAIEMRNADLVDKLLRAGANRWKSYRDSRVDGELWRYAAWFLQEFGSGNWNLKFAGWKK